MVTERKTLDDLKLMIAEGLEDLSYKQAKHVLGIMFPGIKIRVDPNQYRNGVFDVTWYDGKPAAGGGSSLLLNPTGDAEQGGISDRLGNFDDYGDRIRERS